MTNKIQSIIEENEKEFEEKYYNKNTPSGLNQDFRYMKVMVDDIKSHLHQSQLKLLAGIREMIEGMAFVNPAEAGQFAMHSDGYNQAIEEVVELLSLPETNKEND